MTRMTKKKLIKRGYMEERTIEKITADYNTECFIAGHKARLIKQWKEDIEKTEKEIIEHLDNSIKFNLEAIKLQKEEQKKKQEEKAKTEETKEDIDHAIGI